MSWADLISSPSPTWVPSQCARSEKRQLKGPPGHLYGNEESESAHNSSDRAYLWRGREKNTKYFRSWLVFLFFYYLLCSHIDIRQTRYIVGQWNLLYLCVCLRLPFVNNTKLANITPRQLLVDVVNRVPVHQLLKINCLHTSWSLITRRVWFYY